MIRVCLITVNHPSFQPRVLREADAFQDAGYDVRVVCRQSDLEWTESDRRLARTRRWKLQALDLCRQGPRQRHWFVEGVRSKLSRWLFEAGLRLDNLAIRGYVRGSGHLTALAASEPADWFIAHTQGALPIAAMAARLWKARLGFDCEDLLAENVTDPPEIVRLIERKYLSLCDYVSVPSHCIADRLIREYRIHEPVVLYNVFPSSLAGGMLPPRQRQSASALRLHWFGQTLGPGRGIEEAIKAMGLINKNVELHLRGRLADGYRSVIERLARRKGVGKAVVFHSLVDHDSLTRTMDQFDVGLALERAENGNASLTVSNKIFGYLLAGLAVAATDTRGQRELMEQIPSAGFLYEPDNPRALADGLHRWLKDRQALRDAQQSAWNVARQRFCWDLEKQKLFRMIEISSMRSFDRVVAGSSC